MSNLVEDFMSRLHAQQESMRKPSFKKDLEKIALNFPGNFGRYQIFPVSNVVTGILPFVVLPKTYEICIPKTFKNNDVEEVKPAWIKIIPKSAYVMRASEDGGARTRSSLTKDEEVLLEQAHLLASELYEELDAKNNRDVTANLLRRRNYTIFNGYCSNFWREGNERQPDRENFSGLFVSTAAGFSDSIEKNITEKSYELDDKSNEWLAGIYNRLATGRSGCLMMTIGRSKTTSGYDVSCNHLYQPERFKEYTIPQESLDSMQDPLATFLGWQARREDDSVSPENRRLFNPVLIEEAIQFMSSKLAAVRAQKSAGGTLDLQTIINNAAAVTNNSAIGAGATSATNDPMLQQGPSVNPAAIQNNNNAPFSTAPVFHTDPVTGAPVGNGNSAPQSAAPFSSPSFANFGNANNTQQPPF